METIITFLVFAAGQLAEHQDVIGIAVAIGGALAAALSIYRRYVLTRELAKAGASLWQELAEEPASHAGGSAVVRSNAAAGPADTKQERRVAPERRAYGFWQNFLFFILGTVTSIVLQGLT